VGFLEGHQGLRKAMGMEEKLPHYTTLQKFSRRSKVLEIVDLMIGRIGKVALRMVKQHSEVPAVAMDATGLETSVASTHYLTRKGQARRKWWLKLSMTVVCGALFPLGLVVDWGPNNDKCQAAELLDKSRRATASEPLQRLYADAGYDADWIHAQCRQEWGVESVIKPVYHRADRSLGGTYRAKMTATHLQRKGYGRRWHIESFFSGLKRTMGSALFTRLPSQQQKEASLRVLAYALFR
jgi:hypothetical protein